MQLSFSRSFVRGGTVRTHRRVAIAAVCAAGVLFAATGIATGHESTKTHPAPKGMTVAIRLHKDAMSGWNLEVRTRNFRWAPQRVNGKHRPGEGHAHLYIDGQKITRLYGPWYYLKADLLPPGKHTVRVTLNGNDHGDYVRKGKVVAATKTIVVPRAGGGAGSSGGGMSMAN